MGIEENKEVVRDFVERMAKGDSSAVDELTPENLIIHSLNGGIQTGTGKEVRESFKQLNDGGHITWPDYSMTIEDLIAEGDKVVVRLTRRGTHLGQFGALAPTNKSIEVGRIYIARLENGEIVELWIMEDFLGMYQQLGFTLTPPTQETEN